MRKEPVTHTEKPGYRKKRGIKMDEEELKKSGVDLILNKPFTMDNILKLTGDALVVKKGSSPHQEGNSG